MFILPLRCQKHQHGQDYVKGSASVILILQGTPETEKGDSLPVSGSC